VSSIFNIPNFPNPSFNAVDELPTKRVFVNVWIRFFQSVYQKIYFPTIPVNSPTGTPVAVTVNGAAYIIDTSGAAVTANLPTSIGLEGKYVTFKNINLGLNNLTVAANGAETIDGAATAILAANAKITIISDGANWHTI
jgi:hypothetical protein